MLYSDYFYLFIGMERKGIWDKYYVGQGGGKEKSGFYDELFKMVFLGRLLIKFLDLVY